MQGRFHYYEGWNMQQVTFPIRILKAMGVEYLIITNICGGLNKQFEECDLMIIEDHINLLPNPLIGPNDDSLGKRHSIDNVDNRNRWPSMKEPYCKDLIKKVTSFALSKGVQVHKGVYVGVSGIFHG